MPTLAETIDILEEFAPLELAEEWDNVGLLVGDRRRAVSRVMTCLTLTPSTVDEAVREAADLVVVHHPLPFRPLKRITAESTVGRLLLALIEAQIAVYSPHTAFDSAREGINQRLAEGLGLADVRPLAPVRVAPRESSMGAERGSPPSTPTAGLRACHPTLGSGRIGEATSPLRLAEVAAKLKQFLAIASVRAVGRQDAQVQRTAIACGSGGTMLDTAMAQGTDCFITGEMSFHSCLEAEANGVGLLLVGHYASERFALELLADFLSRKLVEASVWAARSERDPLYTI